MTEETGARRNVVFLILSGIFVFAKIGGGGGNSRVHPHRAESVSAKCTTVRTFGLMGVTKQPAAVASSSSPSATRVYLRLAPPSQLCPPILARSPAPAPHTAPLPNVMVRKKHQQRFLTVHRFFRLCS